MLECYWGGSCEEGDSGGAYDDLQVVLPRGTAWMELALGSSGCTVDGRMTGLTDTERSIDGDLCCGTIS